MALTPVTFLNARQYPTLYSPNAVFPTGGSRQSVPATNRTANVFTNVFTKAATDGGVDRAGVGDVITGFSLQIFGADKAPGTQPGFIGTSSAGYADILSIQRGLGGTLFAMRENATTNTNTIAYQIQNDSANDPQLWYVNLINGTDIGTTNYQTSFAPYAEPLQLLSSTSASKTAGSLRLRIYGYWPSSGEIGGISNSLSTWAYVVAVV